MSNTKSVKIDLQIKIKHAFVYQIKDALDVSVIWRRGTRELESKQAKINPTNHQALIDDVFKMKTSLDYNIREQKFDPKITIMNLIFTETKGEIGFIELDLAQYVNNLVGKDKSSAEKEKIVKKVLDLKSDKFPGAQIYVYLSVGLLEELPVEGKVLDASQLANLANVQQFDAESNAQELKKQKLHEENRLLQIEKDKKVHDLERLEHRHQQLLINDNPAYMQLLKAKTEQLNKIKEKIKKIGRQEAIIVKVLNIINDTDESKKMYDQTDQEIQEQLEMAKQEWDKKNKESKKLKNVKKNFGDIDYFADMVQF